VFRGAESIALAKLFPQKYSASLKRRSELRLYC